MEASPAIYIEVDAADADTLCEHLGDYKLLSKVSIEALDADAAASFVSMEHNASTRGLDDEMGLVSFADPRGQAVTAYGGAIVGVAELGPAFVRAEQPPPPLHPLRRHYRLLPTSAAAAAASSSSSTSTNAISPSVVASPPVAVPASTQASASAARADTSYTRFLFERGVAEGRGLYDEDRPIVAPKGATGAAGRVFYGTQLPFEGNLDQLGAIAFDKGCYIGQELVHRTRTQLVVRRRVVPIMVSPTTTTAETIMPTAVTTTVAEENAPLSSSGSGLVLVLPRGTYLYATADAALKGDFAHAVGRVLKCVPGHADAPSPATADAAAGVAILKLDTLNPAALEASLFAVVGVRNGSHVANGGGAAAAGVTSGTAPTDEAAAAHLVPVRAYVPTWWADSVIDSSLAITDAPGVDETA
jgi:folate-binding protein YgfZ